MKKKLLALVLALTMALSLLPVTAMAAGPHTVTFDANGATSGTVPPQKTAAAGETFKVPDAGNSTFPGELLKQSCGFIGWYDGERTYKRGDIYTMPDHDVTFTAQWLSIKIDSFDSLDDIESGKKIINVRYTVTPFTTTDHTLDIWWIIAGDGNSLIATRKGATIDVPANMTLSNLELTSHFTAVDIMPGKDLSNATQLRLHVRDEGSNRNSADRAYCVKSNSQSAFHKGYYVTLDNNGGLYNGSTENPVIFVDASGDYGSFEWVDKSLYSRVGYTFKGFADKRNDTAADYTSDELEALKWETSAQIKEWFAVWERNTYDVSVSANKGGTVDVPDTALYGDDVSVEITSARGYRVKEVQLTYGNETIDLTNYSSSPFTFESSFTMPAADVELAVEFNLMRTPGASEQDEIDSTVDTTPETEIVTPAKTADPIGLYFGVTVLATVGSAWLAKKKED